MGSYLRGVYLPSDDEEGWGDELRDALRQVEDHGVNVKAFPYGAKGDGVADDSAAIALAIAAANGREVFFPPGTYLTSGGGVLFNTADVRLRGSGMWQTTIRRKDGSSASPVMIANVASKSVQVEDMTLDGNVYGTLPGGTSQIVWQGGGVGLGQAIFRRLRFINNKSSCIALQNCKNVLVEDSIFQGDATVNGGGVGVSITGGCYDVRIRNNWFLYTYQGIVTSGTHNRRIVVEGNHIDLGWWFAQTEYTGTGGLVSYGALTLTDTGANFPAFVPYQRRVRALTPLRSTSGAGISYQGSTLTDTGALFTTYGIARGDLVRTAAGFAVVAKVPTSDTVLQVEGWLDSTTYQPVAANIAAGTAYTVYRLSMGMIESNTSTVLTIYFGGWRRLDGTTGSVPTAGTLYEIMHNVIYPVQASVGTEDVRVVNNTILRSFGDMLEMQAERYSIVGNYLYGGSDVGIALTAAHNGLCVGNVVDFCGTTGIYVSTDGTVVGNKVTNSQWFNTVDANGTGDITIEHDSKRINVVGNHLEHDMGLGADSARWGIAVRGENPYATDGHTIIGNTAIGHNQAGYRFYATGGGGGKVRFRDNYGSVSVAAPSNWTLENDSEILADAATVAIDASFGKFQLLTTAASRAFGAPVNMMVGSELVLEVKNTSGGNITPTYNAVFKLVGAAGPTIGAGKRQSVSFRYDGTNWNEFARTAGDV